jgi:hypothetical protein
MNKEDVLGAVDALESLANQLRSSITKAKVQFVNRTEIQQSAQQVSRKWFEDIEPALDRFGITSETKQKYSTFFNSLLTLSTKPSQTKSYLRIIDAILQDLRPDIAIPIMRSPGKIVSILHLSKILGAATEEEKEFLNEAIGCAGQGFFRASIVLGWSAAVHRIHKVVEKLGFDKFNRATEEMKKISTGRFKFFNKTFTVNSMNELRVVVFDNDLLWIIEYLGLIDSNQHDRLSTCLTMRNNSAHPGEAPITEDNLSSFYSDLKTMIFENPKLSLKV